MSENLVKVTIDDVELDVPAGTLVIRAAEKAGIRIPRFCDHPLLEPVAAECPIAIRVSCVSCPSLSLHVLRLSPPAWW